MTASKSRGALHYLGLFKTSLHGSNLSLKHVHRQFPNQFQTKAYCGGEKIHNQSSTDAQTKREAMYKPKHIYTSVNSHNYRTSPFYILARRVRSLDFSKETYIQVQHPNQLAAGPHELDTFNASLLSRHFRASTCSEPNLQPVVGALLLNPRIMGKGRKNIPKRWKAIHSQTKKNRAKSLETLQDLRQLCPL